ncbi:hypothetical protein [Haloechinothrix sp. LS1_15]|uniref:hypothetical protein n=1 Tax=Haloechinothrix sp. LS1_15 TaxID=2652248 RepID=UPI00294604C9|nr:hypothetical protein [Haloechinothrix sp. LS1_15]MDV6014477.1 hypothetical protein [Haloechinothrix sp. LS1_15]
MATALLALLLAVAMGCATAGGDGSTADPEETTTPETGEPDDANSGDRQGGDGQAGNGEEEATVPPERIDGSALPEGYPTEVVIRDGGRTLVITARESSGCVTASAELAGQADRHVTVLLVHTRAEGDVMCTQQVSYPEVTVALDEPLADRTVLLRAEER